MINFQPEMKPILNIFTRKCLHTAVGLLDRRYKGSGKTAGRS
jgi:hypothetical protein